MTIGIERVFALVALLFLAQTLAGCAAIGFGGALGAAISNPQQILVPGRTTRADVQAAIGDAMEAVSDPDSGDEVWVYNNEFKVPFLISIIPVVGDIADLVELAHMGDKKRELIVLFDKAGVVRRFEVRDLD